MLAFILNGSMVCFEAPMSVAANPHKALRIKLALADIEDSRFMFIRFILVPIDRAAHIS